MGGFPWRKPRGQATYWTQGLSSLGLGALVGGLELVESKILLEKMDAVCVYLFQFLFCFCFAVEKLVFGFCFWKLDFTRVFSWLDEVLFCLNSNRVASFTSATCSLRFGEARKGCPKWVISVTWRKSDSKDTAFLRFMTWKPAIQMYMIYIPKGPSLGFRACQSRLFIPCKFLEKAKNESKKCPFFGGIFFFWG